MNGALSRREFVEKGSTAAIFSAASLGRLATACGRRAEDRARDGNERAAPSAAHVREIASTYGMVFRS